MSKKRRNPIKSSRNKKTTKVKAKINWCEWFKMLVIAEIIKKIINEIWSLFI